MQDEINRLADLIIKDIRDDAVQHGSNYNEAVIYLNQKKKWLYQNSERNPVYAVQVDLITDAIIALKKEAMQLPLKDIKN